MGVWWPFGFSREKCQISLLGGPPSNCQNPRLIELILNSATTSKFRPQNFQFNLKSHPQYPQKQNRTVCGNLFLLLYSSFVRNQHRNIAKGLPVDIGGEEDHYSWKHSLRESTFHARTGSPKVARAARIATRIHKKASRTARRSIRGAMHEKFLPCSSAFYRYRIPRLTPKLPPLELDLVDLQNQILDRATPRHAIQDRWRRRRPFFAQHPSVFRCWPTMEDEEEDQVFAQLLACSYGVLGWSNRTLQGSRRGTQLLGNKFRGWFSGPKCWWDSSGGRKVLYLCGNWLIEK